MSKSAINLIGQKFHRLTVVSRAENGKRGQVMWYCLCDCGNKTIVKSFNLRGKHIKSCGCFRSSKNGKSKTSECEAWYSMKKRCQNPKDKSWKNYGGRGINICKQWNNSFETFLKDMGLKPTFKHKIERIDNDGNYEPNNCVWATQFQQSRNMRTNRYITFKGKKLCIADWSYSLGGNHNLIHDRLKMGWPTTKALSTPVKK